MYICGIIRARAILSGANSAYEDATDGIPQEAGQLESG
jgi:hypothetical protein